jgi:hypothetical protein
MGKETMIKKLLLLGSLLLSGCAFTNNYAVCMQTQEKMAKDMVVMEAARIQALIEMTKSNDPSVRATGLMLLQKNDIRQLQLDCKNN